MYNMINGLDIYYSKKERSHGKGLAPISKKINLVKALNQFQKEKDVKNMEMD